VVVLARPFRLHDGGSGLAAGPSRRCVLVGLFAVCVVPAVAAAAKLTQSEAAYQDHPRGGLSCIGCTFFRRPNGCEVVSGMISPTGWCKLFDLPD
jgi:hypothetical protein